MEWKRSQGSYLVAAVKSEVRKATNNAATGEVKTAMALGPPAEVTTKPMRTVSSGPVKLTKAEKKTAKKKKK